jgi:hypothetical protein
MWRIRSHASIAGWTRLLVKPKSAEMRKWATYAFQDHIRIAAYFSEAVRPVEVI